ncbi:MAG: ABC transporter permease [Gemmatimonadetes bacterium]|nr:ABC transporter permease [Gemmatimonadota bacterium]
MSELFFRALLRIYPAAVRRHHGEEILGLMWARRRGIRGSRLAVLWLWLLLDTVRAVPLAYAHEWRRRRAARGHPAVDDLRQAWRSLRRRPAGSFAIVLCFALGVGGVTAASSFFYGVLIRPLPFHDVDRLAVLYNTAPGFTRASPSYADFVAWREQTHAFSALAAYGSTTATLPGPEGPERVDGCAVTYDFFRVLGTQPVLGRGPNAHEDNPGAPATVVLSHALWQARFASDPAVLGRTIVMDGEAYTVTGVMPAGFDYPAGARFWRPMRRGYAAGTSSGQVGSVLGRLAPGSSFDLARAEMRTIARVLQKADPRGHAQREIAVRPFADDLLWGWKGPVSGFLLVCSLIFLLALGNVAHLLLAQSTIRNREMVLRSALGAGRQNLLRQLVAEGVILAILGGALGVGLGVLGRNLYLLALPVPPPGYLDFTIGGPLMAAIVVGTLGTGVVVGLVPALDTLRQNLLPNLGAGHLQPPGSRGRLLRSVLIGGQIGIALIVLIGAGTALSSAVRLNRVSLGFDPSDVLTMRIALPAGERENPEGQRLLFDRIQNRVAALPGVTGSALVSNLPVGGMAAGTSVYVEHTEPPQPGHEPWIISKAAQPGYFGVMRIPLLAGRAFTTTDGAPGEPPVVVVNESFARRYWPDGSPLGKRIKYGAAGDTRWPWMEVVGVVGDVRHFGRARPVELGIYEPFRQEPYWREFFTVRTGGNPGSLVDELRAVVRQVSPNAVVYDLRSMSAVLYEDQWQSVVYTRILAVFSVLGLTLAAVGVFGVVAFSTARRFREFGVRLALGAQQGSILASAGRGVTIPVVSGIVGGLLLATVLVPLASSLFYDVHRLDPLVAGASAVSLALIALVATWLPARRALKADPLQALRAE